MKKIVSLFMVAALMFSFAACSNSAQEETASDVQQEGESISADQTTQPSNDTSAADSIPSEDKVLVVYYSATGNTENVANYIAAATDGDVFELEPTEPYSDADLNWTDDNSRVVREHDNPDERDVALVKSTVENWDEYDTVFIGYPIWWGIAAWPVDGFIEANDFTGKTVIPFATSSSSGLGESGKLLAEMAGTGDWQEGQRFSSGVSESDVTAWVESLER